MKLKSLLITLLALLGSIKANANLYYDFCVNDIYYSITSGNKCSVTYPARSYDDEEDGYWLYYVENSQEYEDDWNDFYIIWSYYSGSVSIPSNVTYNGQTYQVTAIGDHAFENCRNLNSVSIPNSVTSIGYNAFRNSSLSTITLPSSLTTIGNGAFERCNSLEALTIPGSVTSIGSEVFSYSNLAVIDINATNLTSIGSAAFKKCYRLKTVNINSIASWLNCTLLSESSSPFCNGADLYVANEEQSILSFPVATTNIPAYAFYGCNNITSISFPSHVRNIGDGAFALCPSLTAIDVNSNNSYLSFEDGILYQSNKTSLVVCIKTKSGSVNIPQSVTTIQIGAFNGCSSLTSITIPSSITSMERLAFSGCSGTLTVNCNIPDYNYSNSYSVETYSYIDSSNSPFFGSSFSSITFGNNVTSIGSNAFCVCSSITSLSLPSSLTTIGSGAFRKCYGITSITIPNSVTSIGDDAFKNCNLTSVTLPSSLTSIGDDAFYYCRLTSVTLPSSLTSIGESAFGGCKSLTDVYCYAENVPNTETSAFWNIASATTLHVPAGSIEAYSTTAPWNSFDTIVPIETSSPAIAFADANVKALCVANWDTNGDGELSEAEAAVVTSLGNVFQEKTNITLFNELQYFTGLTSIGYEAFYGCSSLTSITIPNSVTSIGGNAFRGCTSLTSITIPNSVTSIGKSAFYNCTSLTSITIGNSVTSIGDYAFYGCTRLTSITIPNSVTSIGSYSYAFLHCTSLTSIQVETGNTTYDSRDNCNAIIETATNTLIAGCQNTTIPNSVTSIGHNAFSDCTRLTSITIPNSVTSIGDYAFDHCTSLTSITIPNSVTSISNYAFYGCTSLTDVYCYAENVPTATNNAFSIYSATLHVPAASLEAYSTTAPWSGFGSIRAIEVEYVTNLLSNKWSGAEYSVQAATFDSGVNYGNGTESNPNYNQIVGVPETDSKGRNWYEFDYTCNWQEMTAPLNNWCQDGNFGDIYARRTFYYDEEMPEELFLACGHDDAPCEYYLNGELIWSVTDGWFEQEIYKLTSAQKALLRPGELNVLAFHVHQNWGGMYADCGLYTSLSEMGISNKCGDNLIWSFNGETETLTISGTGDMYDFSDNSQTPWIGFKNSIKNLDVQSGVTRIGGNAFNGCTALSSVTISNSVTVVGSWAFCDCKSLTSITIPEGVINIRDNVFRNCTSLTSVSLPESLKTLGGHAFLGCRSLASITIPDGITFLDRIAFQECSSLTTFTYNKAENALTKVNGVYQIGTAEDLCNFAILSTAANSDISAQLTADIDYTGYTFPGSNVGEHFQHIGLNGYRGMFDGNGHTITVNINNPDSWQVAALFRELGKGGVIKNLRVAGHVESVSKFSAGIVSNLKSGKVSHCVSDVDIISHIDGDCTDGGIAGIATYDGEESIVEYCVVAGSFQGSNAHHRGGIIGIGYAGNSDNITIDNCLFLANVDGLDVTESGTFIRQPTDKTTINNCYYLNVLGTVTSGTQTTTAQMTSGELCFLLNGNQSNINWTQNLTGTDADTYPLPFSTHAQVYAYDNTYSNTDLSPVITFADANVKALCVANWDTNGDGELSEAEAAAVADLGEVFRGNTTITSFNELQYFTSLTTIGDNAFRECTALTSVTIPEGVQHIGYWAFCESGLTSITLPEGITNFCNAVFAGCRSLTSVEWPSDMTEIADYTFYQCSSLTSIHIPDGVTTIGHSAFRESGLESIAFPNSVTNIGSYVFDDCNNLTTVTMPASVITFDENDGNAFGDTNNIEAVYISDLTAWLNTSFPQANNPLRSGAKLYLNNVEVKDLVIPEGTTAILKAAFEGCESLTSVSIPSSVTSIDEWAFAKCNNLTSATIPESVTSIGNHLFAYCSSLTSVTIPSSVTFIGNYAFADCGCLTGISVPNSVTSIGEGAFWGCAVATSINIPENLTSIEPYVFFNCPSLTSFTIPNGVTNVGELAFEWCNMTDVYCYAENVPNTNSNAFENSSISTATLHVPAASLEAYSTTAPWSGFGTIVPIADDSNTLSIPEITRPAGGRAILSINLKNSVPIETFNFDLSLSEGLSVATDKNGNPRVSLSTQRTTPSAHVLSTTILNDGALRVQVSAPSAETFSGNDGEVLQIVLNINSDLEPGAELPIVMKNVTITDNAAEVHNIERITSHLTIASYKLGDLNGDGRVNSGDYTALVHYQLGLVLPSTFVEAATDVNGDGIVNSGDLTGIIHLCLYESLDRPATQNSVKELIVLDPQ